MIRLLVIGSLLVPAMAFAQPPGPRGERGAKMGERMKEMRSRVLREKVGLAEADAQAIEAVLQKYDPERQKLHQKKRQTRQALRALFQSDSNDQEAYRVALKDARDVHEALHNLRQTQMAAVSKMLSPKQQAKLMMAMHRMKKRHMRGGGRHRGEKAFHRRGEQPADEMPEAGDDACLGL